MPLVTITDDYREDDKASRREKTISVLGLLIYKMTESYAGQRKDQPIGFQGPGIALTPVGDESDDED